MLVLTGCTGVVEGPPGTSGGPTAANQTPTPSGDPSSGDQTPPQNADLSKPPAVACSKPNVGESPLRRITASQYAHAVRDLLGGQAVAADSLPEDERLGTFRSNLSAPPALAPR